MPRIVRQRRQRLCADLSMEKSFVPAHTNSTNTLRVPDSAHGTRSGDGCVVRPDAAGGVMRRVSASQCIFALVLFLMFSISIVHAGEFEIVVASGVSPSAREGHAQATLDASQIAVLFGGANAKGPLNDTWLFSIYGQDWELFDYPGPSGRAGHSLAPSTPNLVLVFGGYIEEAEQIKLLNDTWILAPFITAGFARGYTQVDTSSSNAPVPRYGHTCVRAMDEGDGVVLFGGQGAMGALDDLWRFKMSTMSWEPIVVNSRNRKPSARYGHTAIVVSDENVMVMFGGLDQYNTPLSEVWQFHITTSEWIQGIAATETIEPRAWSVSALIGIKMFIHGGEGVDGFGSGLALEDSWMFDIFTNQWTRLQNGGAVPRVSRHSVAYIAGKAVVFGGRSSSVEASGFTNVLDLAVVGSLWELLRPAGAKPEKRAGHIAGSFGLQNEMLIWGGAGLGGDFTGGAPRSDMWSLSGNVWSRIEDIGFYKPDGRSYCSTLQIGAELVMFGGLKDFKEMTNELWSLNVDRKEWTVLDSDNAPSPRAHHTAVQLHETRMYIYGGVDQSFTPLDELWYIDFQLPPAPSAQANGHRMLFLDGQNSHLTVDFDPLVVLRPLYTIEMHVRLNGMDSANPFILCDLLTSNEPYQSPVMRLAVINGLLTIEDRTLDGRILTQRRNSTKLLDQHWHHVAAIMVEGDLVTGGTISPPPRQFRMALVIDGEEVAAINWLKRSTVSNIYAVAFGAYPFSYPVNEVYVEGGVYSPNYLDGFIDEVRFWRVARSVLELKNNMFQPLPQTSVPWAGQGLLAYFPFDGNDVDLIGRTVLDQVTGEHIGNLGGLQHIESMSPSPMLTTMPDQPSFIQMWTPIVKTVVNASNTSQSWTVTVPPTARRYVGKWVKLPPYTGKDGPPGARFSHTALAIGGNRLLVAGGLAEFSATASALPHIFQLNLEEEIWELYPTTEDSPRAGAKGWALGYHFVGIFGGVTRKMQLETLQLSASQYNIRTGTSTLLRVDVLSSFSGHSLVIVGDSAIIFGGLIGGIPTSGLLKYTISQSSAIAITSQVTSEGPKPTPRAWPLISQVGNLLYVFGGAVPGPTEETIVALGDFYSFETDTFTWSRQQDSALPGPLAFASLSLVNHRNGDPFLVMFGGTRGPDVNPLRAEYLNSVFIYDITRAKWEEIIFTFDTCQTYVNLPTDPWGCTLTDKYQNVSVPDPRAYHAATSVSGGGATFDTMFVHGGRMPGTYKVFRDMWMLKNPYCCWLPVNAVPKDVTKGTPGPIFGHSMVSFKVASGRTRIVLYGGEFMDLTPPPVAVASNCTGVNGSLTEGPFTEIINNTVVNCTIPNATNASDYYSRPPPTTVHNKNVWTGDIFEVRGVWCLWNRLNVGETRLPGRRDHAAGLVNNYRLLVHGGLLENGDLDRRLWTVDLRGDGPYVWQDLELSDPRPPAQSRAAMLISGDTMFLYGGQQVDETQVNGWSGIDTLWSFKLTAAFPQACSATGSGLCNGQAGVASTFSIFARDIFGDGANGAVFEVNIQGPVQIRPSVVEVKASLTGTAGSDVITDVVVDNTPQVRVNCILPSDLIDEDPGAQVFGGADVTFDLDIIQSDGQGGVFIEPALLATCFYWNGALFAPNLCPYCFAAEDTYQPFNCPLRLCDQGAPEYSQERCFNWCDENAVFYDKLRCDACSPETYNAARCHAQYCSGVQTMTSTHGVIDDGSLDSDYQPLANCGWIIVPDGAKRINISFTELALIAIGDPISPGVQIDDTIRIYDGPTTFHPLMATISGHLGHNASYYITSGGAASVWFESDILFQNAGFTLVWEGLDSGIPPAQCKGRAERRNSSGTISIGNNDYYSPSSDCEWLVVPQGAETIIFTFVQLDTAEQRDLIRIYDGNSVDAPLLGEFSGMQEATPFSVETTAATGLVKFFSGTFEPSKVVMRTGFQLHYEGLTPNECSGQQNLTAFSGHISDGTGMRASNGTLDCSWLIKPENALSLTLTFVEFSIGNGFVALYNGETTNDDLIITFSGGAIPIPVPVKDAALLVVYKSYGPGNGGFSARYSGSSVQGLKVGGGPCTGSTHLDAAQDGFGDGSFLTSLYAPNMECIFLIEVPGATSIALNFNLFEVFTADQMVIYDGLKTDDPILATLTGIIQPNTTISTSNRMRIDFKSFAPVPVQAEDGPIVPEYRGFLGSYLAVSAYRCGGLQTLQTETGRVGDGTSVQRGNPLDFYEGNLDCRWLISPFNVSQIALRIADFDTVDFLDNVTIYDGPSTSSPVLAILSGSGLYNESRPFMDNGTYVGKITPFANISSSILTAWSSTGTTQMLITFSSPRNATTPPRRGFTMWYTSTPLIAEGHCFGPKVIKDVRGYIRSGPDGYAYKNMASCSWQLAMDFAVVHLLDFEVFDLEENYDFVRVYRGPNSHAPLLLEGTGNTLPPNMKIYSSHVFITFDSDYSNAGGAGFKILFRQQTPACDPFKLVTNATGNITDGGGDNPYIGEIECAWQIAPVTYPPTVAIELNFTQFETEFFYDTLEVFEGNHTGNATPVVVWSGDRRLGPPPLWVSKTGVITLVFKSEVTKFYSGFELLYRAILPCHGVQRMTAPEGTIDDGSRALDYRPLAACAWSIEPPGTGTITIEWEMFRTEYLHDYVKVVDGPCPPLSNNGTDLSQEEVYFLFRDVPAIHMFTGTLHQEGYVSPNSSVCLAFISDREKEDAGFRGYYHQTYGCNGTQVLTNLSGNFTDSTDDTYSYRPNTRCRWLINPPNTRSITLDVSFLDTEPMYDTVTIYDGPTTNARVLARLSGPVAPNRPFVGTGSAMLVDFRTDAEKQGWGFAASYRVAPLCEGLRALNASAGYVTDGSDAGKYHPNTNCQWLLEPWNAQTVLLKWRQFDTEFAYDLVRVYDGDSTNAPVLGNFSGSGLPDAAVPGIPGVSAVQSTGPKMLVWFVSDGTRESEGWGFDYTYVGYCNALTVSNQSNGNITDGSGDSNYYANSDCKWLIQPNATSVLLQFYWLNTELNRDFIRVYDGSTTSAPLLKTLTGITWPQQPIVSTHGAMLVWFTASSLKSQHGFTASWTVPQQCDGAATLTDRTGQITDGSGAGLYAPMKSCSWLLQPVGALTVILSFTAFDTEMDTDIVRVYDGDSSLAPLIANYSGNGIERARRICASLINQPAPGGTATLANTATATATATGTGTAATTAATTAAVVGTATTTSGGTTTPGATLAAGTTMPGATVAPGLCDDFVQFLPPYSLQSSGPSMFVTWTTDATRQYNGFTADYQYVKYCTLLQVLRPSTGVFSDGSGNSNYQGMSNCMWHIKPTAAKSIKLSFTMFDTESGMDFVRVYDGSTTDAKLLAELSGSSLPDDIESTCGSFNSYSVFAHKELDR